LGKLGWIWTKFGQNCDESWAKVIRFGEKSNFAFPRTFISYGYGYESATAVKLFQKIHRTPGPSFNFLHQVDPSFCCIDFSSIYLFLFYKISNISDLSLQGRNQDFAKRGGGLKMEKSCDIILLT